MMDNIVLLAQSFESYGSFEISPIFIIGYLALVVVLLAAMWTIFSKAGKSGWLAIIPIVNIFVMLDIAGKPWWWVIGFFIPFVNFIVIILMWHGISTNFGKSSLFTLGLLFLSPIFLLILAFGDAEYIGGGKAKAY